MNKNYEAEVASRAASLEYSNEMAAAVIVVVE